MPSLDRTARVLREYDENMARKRREVTRQKLKQRTLINQHEKLINTKELKYEKLKLVPHSGWNFASTPTDRENTIENSQNSQFCSIQASHGRKKINENS